MIVTVATGGVVGALVLTACCESVVGAFRGISADVRLVALILGSGFASCAKYSSLTVDATGTASL